MTLTAAPTRTWQPRSELHLAAQQLQAIVRFNAARRSAEQAATVVVRSRERRMDDARSLEVLRREHEAVVSRAHEQLRVSGRGSSRVVERRVVLAHRSPWFLDKVARELRDGGLSVVARVDNGADAVGLAVAEQPDLLLVEDVLAMVPGEQVVRDVRRYCPDTVVVAQAAHGTRVGLLLEAGATTVFTPSLAPAAVARSLLDLLAA